MRYKRKNKFLFKIFVQIFFMRIKIFIGISKHEVFIVSNISLKYYSSIKLIQFYILSDCILFFTSRSPRPSKSLAVPLPVDHSPLWTALTHANAVSAALGDT